MIGDTFNDLNWRIAPDGSIIDEFGGLVAGDSLTCLQSLTAEANGTDRFHRLPAIMEMNTGEWDAEMGCSRREAEIRKARKEHLRVFGCYGERK